jgi:hypothetical protein
MMELDKIRNHNLEDPEMTRQYHTALSGIFRLYLSRKLHINLMNKTTGEVLVEIPGKHISHEQVSRLAAALRCGDAVKFAKYLPPGIESRDCFDKIKETIDITEQSSAIKQT